MILPDKFIDQDKPELMYKLAGLDSQAIEEKVMDLLHSKYSSSKAKIIINFHIELYLRDNDQVTHNLT